MVLAEQRSLQYYLQLGRRTATSSDERCTFKLNMLDGIRTSLVKRQQKEARQPMATEIMIWDEIFMTP
ncbi:hypothetical protein NECAME_11154 [Necator americanus]|uniref:Uncharacterized protein n=1 Tax=Necator americanus TaxID=51031 RepID=W2T807_NECAM|nr:hypothetical protein NECAME_11154 [Necator americanus]ETN77281.1 hypothetical protein NECAME_11154 [Necator americanus]